MRLTITRPGSVDYERVRWLIALWGKPGAAAVLGGGGAITPTPPCLFQFLDGNDAQFLDGQDWQLLGCNDGNMFQFLDGEMWLLLDGNVFAPLG